MANRYSNTAKPMVIGPLNRCIYCGNENTADLSREHVVPFGLGGGYIILKASCSVCSDITKRFETKCLQKNWGEWRWQGGVTSRNPKRRPSHLPVLLLKDDGFEEKNVPIAERPAVLVMIEFNDPPALLTGSETPTTGSIIKIVNAADNERMVELHGGPVGVGGLFDGGAVVQLLAKIAHGLTVMHFEADSFEPTLLGVILKKELKNSWRLVGAGLPFSLWPRMPLATGHHDRHQFLVEIISSQRGYFLVVRMQLFTGWGAPTYSVIAGRCDALPRMRC